MKPAVKIMSRTMPLVIAYLPRFRHCLGIVLLSIGIVLLNACAPGSSGGGVDPGIVEIPIAFIKRPIPVDDMSVPVQADMREPLLFSAGGDLYLRDSTRLGADVTNLTRSVTGGTGDIKGLNVSYDGTKLIFSLRLMDPNPNDDVVPRWNIYEFDLEEQTLRPIITDFLTSELGDDLFPSYLPDGRIVFTSNRQRQSREMRINEGKSGYASLDEDRDTLALVLHVMNANGTDIHQISFNQSHDLYPQVSSILDDGKIIFSRWDHAGPNNAVSLYKMNPDGSELEVVYGINSHATGTGGANIQFTQVREMENKRLMVIAKPFTGTFDGGDILIVDADRFADIDKPIWSLTGLSGPAQYSATISNVATDGSISIPGRFSSAYPLLDGSDRILVSRSSCRVLVAFTAYPCREPYLSEPGVEELSPAYSIWLYDTDVDTAKPVVLGEFGEVITEAITVEARDRPAVIFDRALAGQLDTDWVDELVGVVNIKSVYDLANGSFNGCFFNVCTAATGIDSVQDFADPMNAIAAERPARFVRFIKAVGIPDADDPDIATPPDLDNDAFGLQRNRGMREIVGYAAVEPDGSVKVKVPANIPLAVEVLDAAGRRIGPTHFNWFQVQPGDTLNCIGCHDTNTGSATPEIHARLDGHAPSINSGVPAINQLVNTLVPGLASPNPYPGAFGETMAEVRFNATALAMPNYAEPQLTSDLVYDDYWTDPAVRAADASFAYRYANLDATIASPENAFCQPGWLYNCRVAINYPQQIHSLWQLDRGVDDFTPVAPGDPVDMTPNGIGDDTCIECHRTADAANNPQVAHGQLDLTTDPNQDPNNFFRAYAELLLADEGQELDAGGNLINIQIMVPDGMGGFDLVDDPAAAVSPSMTANGARASYFIEKMTGNELDAARAISGTVDHSAMMSADELKLISEWLDLGAQNFNDPFDPAAPQN